MQVSGTMAIVVAAGGWAALKFLVHSPDHWAVLIPVGWLLVWYFIFRAAS